MHVVGKLALMGVAALLLCVVVASSASAAATARDAGTHANLAVGSTFNGHTTNGTALTGTFFGINTTLTCSTSALTGTVLVNGGGTVVARIDTLTITGCTNQAGVPCSYTATGLPWIPTGFAGGNGGGLITASTTNISLGIGSGSITIANSGGGNCFPFGNTCSFQGSGASVTAGGGTISNTMTGNWSNTTSELTMSNVAIKSTGCGITGGLTAQYELRTGSTITGGNPIELV